MKLGEWARKQGISYATAWRWFKQGTLPSGVRMEQIATGTVIVTRWSPLRQKQSQKSHGRHRTMNHDSIFTYQTSLDATPEQDGAMSRYAMLYG